jgi:ferredoxin
MEFSFTRAPPSVARNAAGIPQRMSIRRRKKISANFVNRLFVSAMIKKITVDRNLCIGAASCIAVASGVFELDGENKAVIKKGGGAKDSGPAERETLEDNTVTDEALLAAAQSCPTSAIFLYDESGKQIHPPA